MTPAARHAAAHHQSPTNSSKQTICTCLVSSPLLIAIARVGSRVLIGFGRPGVDPVVLVKVFLVAAIRGIGSMRETLRIAEVDLSIRRFLGYGLTEALPHHATFSYAQCVRFAHSSVFEQLFTQVLASWRDAGCWMDRG
jgi:hypothetical protein